MTEPQSQMPEKAPPSKRRHLKRALWWTLYAKLAVIGLVVLGAGLLYLRLTIGPLSFGHLPERVAASLAARIGPGWSVTLSDTEVALHEGSTLALRASNLDIRNPEGVVVLRSPQALLSVDKWSLLSATIQPRSIEFQDLQMRATLNRDGSLVLATGQEVGPSSVAPLPAPVEPKAVAEGVTSPVSVAVGSLFELLVGKGGILGALDSARLTNARLAIVDGDNWERATFKRLDAAFTRTGAGGRRFDATLEGPHGAWQISGDAIRDAGGGFHATMLATDAPVPDLMLLTGLSGLPVASDLELSGRIDASFADGRVTQLKARLASNAGEIRIDDRDTSPLPVEQLGIDLSWDEARRTLLVESFVLKGSVLDVTLKGELVSPAGEPGWRATFGGRDLVLPGAAEGDPPVRIDMLDGALQRRDGIEITALKLRGSALSVDLSGTYGRAADPKALKLDLNVAGTDFRSALRLWPEAVSPAVRRYLLENLKAGTVDRLALNLFLSGADMAKAVSGEAIPDSSLRIAFGVSGATLNVSKGLPPLTGLHATGAVTGTSVQLQASRADVRMPDGRVLNASSGTFNLADLWDMEAIARIAFRLQGNADALVSLLQSPNIREIATLDLDPAAITKGRADLQVVIPLAINNVPAFADLPITVNGTVGGVTMERAFAKERLEGGAILVSYDRGQLAIKGDGKLAGAPVLIDVRQGRGQGEANFHLTLDDAARARQGMGFGSQLTGPLPLKVSLPLGRNAKPGTRVEADLQRVAVDGFIPGWTKPAGRAGKLSFTITDGPVREIRDFVLDSGSAQLRGSAVLSAEGALEKADLSTFKLSPGDDMRAQIERVNGVYKVTVRGNVGDARPFMKGMGTSEARTPSRAAQAKDSKEVDLDLALPIITGHNDEAITNVTLKASVRKDALRSLEMKGRLGSSDITGNTAPQAAGGPLIAMEADDAGGLLRFLDVYRRMVGGNLFIQMGAGEGPQSGTLTLHSFALRNETALRRIIPTQTRIVAGRDSDGNQVAVPVDVNEVLFSKARVDFTRSAGRLDFKDAAIWGTQLGFTLGGFIDYARDRTDINGTFVPAYGLNNAFAQVPLFGPLLGGSQYEGLFAVNFRISGQASAPVLTVNPLSAVAPGFLRRLFGAGDGAATPPQPVPGQ